MANTIYSIYVRGQRVLTTGFESDYRAKRAVVLSTVNVFMTDYRAYERASAVDGFTFVDYYIDKV